MQQHIGHIGIETVVSPRAGVEGVVLAPRCGDEIGFAQPRWASYEQKNGSDYIDNRDNFGPGGTGGMM